MHLDYPHQYPNMEVQNKSKRELQEIDDSDSLVNVAELGLFVKHKRERERLSLRAVAKQTQVSASTLSRIENNTGTPDAETLAKLSKWLSLPLDRIIGLQAVLESTAAQFAQGSIVEIVDAHLRADSNLKPEDAKTLNEVFRTLYMQYTTSK
ncbi:MAG: helix-turn-helix transcriptional regulator [Acidobacteria bacterium]|nr:helix-turn-helix transcriptional regulator [Acidobacteriota bacterium]